MATNTRKAILIRWSVVYTLMCAFAVVIISYLVKIQYYERNKWQSMADSVGTRVFDIDPVRGNIFDCNGNLLATSLPIYDIRIDAQALGFTDNEIFDNSVDSLAFLLSKEFKDDSKESYKRELIRIKKSKERYVMFKHKISYTQLRHLVTFPIFRLGKYKGGIMIDERARREKPFDYLAERTIGFTQAGVAKVGLEGSFDKYLSGTSGKRVMQRIAGGTWIPTDDENEIEAQLGKDIVTTLDVNFQDVAEHALMNTLVSTDAEFGTAVLMEVATGEVKAIANLTRVAEGQYTEKYNYAVGERLEPGSTFKLISTMALLDKGYAKPDDEIDVQKGEAMVFGFKVTDSHLGVEKLNLQQAFEVSSNVAFAKLFAQHFGNRRDEFYSFMESIGLNKSLQLQIKGDRAPVYLTPSSKKWNKSDLSAISRGYSIQISPLQLLTVYNAIANNGQMVKPFFVKRVMQAGEVVREYKTEIINAKICKSSTVKQLKNMMEGVVKHGTAHKLKSDIYLYAGKTGTAVIAKGKGGYGVEGNKFYRASFCGYFPADNPKYSCIVLVSSPSGAEIYGAEVALPVFKEIADKVYASALNLHEEIKFTQADFSNDLPFVRRAFKDDVKEVLNGISISSHTHNDSVDEATTDWVMADLQNNSLALQPIKIEKKQMPDVKGMTAKDAIYLLENEGLRVKIHGFGKVKQQSVKPGETVYRGIVVSLKLG